ncbi:MAG: hypothetical protein ABIE07_05245 [Candidatus Zixiibacteriota bacterium]
MDSNRSLKQDSGMIDTLKIIPIEQIVPFENYSDEHANRQINELKLLGTLRNPLLVYPIKDRFLLLDDSCTIKALNTLNIDHVPVQIASKDKVSIYPWQKVVEGWHYPDLVKFCEKFPRQIKILMEASGKLRRDEAEFRFRDRQVVRLRFVSDSFWVRADIYCKLYKDIAWSRKSYRASLEYNHHLQFTEHPKASAVIFPICFNMDELSEFAQKGALLPRGIVRGDLPGRILGIDYSLAILKEKVGVEDKELFLRELIEMRMKADRTTYYFGKVFVFNS